MGFFDKKYCDVCGEKIGLLGNRKLEDGNLCKDCAKKLSPFFSERKKSTVDEIKAQLAYREANREELNNFRPIRRFGEDWMIMIDDAKGQFIVTAHDDYMNYNPDIINLSDVLSCNLSVKDYRTEMKYRNKEGEQVSYDPPRYRYNYDFYIEIGVRHQYFSQIEMKLNTDSVEIISEPPAQGFGGFSNRLASGSGIHPEYNPEYRRYQCMADEIISVLMPGTQNAMPGNNAYGNGAMPGNNVYGGATAMGNGAYGNGMPGNNGAYGNGQMPGNNGTYGNGQMPGNNAAYGGQMQGNNMVNQTSADFAWVCPVCNVRNEGGKFCQGCGTQRPEGM